MQLQQIWKKHMIGLNEISSTNGLLLWALCDIWINWMMQCIMTSSFRVIINGRTGYSFKPKRGIKQEDPLSYISSNICKISRTLYSFHVHARKVRCSIKLNKYGPNIPYLVFADDCIIFCRATRAVARNVKHNFDHHVKDFGSLL